MLPTRESYLRGNEVVAGRTGGQTRQAQSPSTWTRDGACSGAMAAITELQHCGEALLTEAAGPGGISEIATETEHEIQWGACDDFGLAAESTPYPRESECDFRSPIDMHIGHIESTPESMTELRDSQYARC